MKIKGITMKDMLEAIKMASEREKYVKEALARGGRTLVIDENVESLRPFLQKKNYTVQAAYGDDEKIKSNLLDGAVFITNNEKHFISREDRLYYNYGLIVVPNMDTQTLANFVEECLMSSNFGGELLQVWKISHNGSFTKLD